MNSVRNFLYNLEKLFPIFTIYIKHEQDIRSRDRKSTRLNSSHVSISYAVFCLKKKKNNLYFIFASSFFLLCLSPLISTLFPYTTLFRSPFFKVFFISAIVRIPPPT